MTTQALPTDTFTSAPGFETSYETLAPVCSNIERIGTMIVFLRMIATSVRPWRSLSGFAYTW